jgi:hypothetical protein
MKSRKWKLVLLLLCCAMAGNAVAATSDTFTITVTCDFIGIDLQVYNSTDPYGTWALGQLAVGASAVTMTEAQGIKLVNTANVSTDISAYVSSQAASWTNAAAAGANQYKLELKAFGTTQGTPDLSSATVPIVTADPGDDVKTGLAGSTNQFIYGKFTVPTSTTSPAQQTIVVTLLSTPAS